MHGWQRDRWKGLGWVTYMAAAHEGDEDGGDDDGGAEHDQVVLERHEHRGDCIKNKQKISELRKNHHR